MIVGPQSVDQPGLAGRWFAAQKKGKPPDAGWWMLDFPGGFRVVELVLVSLAQWDPFFREARKVLASMGHPSHISGPPYSV